MRRAGRGTFAEIKAAAASYVDAMDGDTRRLDERMRQGVATPEEQAIAATLRDKRKSGRRPQVRVAIRRRAMFWFMFHAIRDGQHDKAVVSLAMEHYNVGRSAAYEVLQEVKAVLSGQATLARTAFYISKN
jgi:hypothetical protein